MKVLHVCIMHMYQYMYDTYGGQNRIPYSLELEVWVIMNCHVGIGI